MTALSTAQQGQVLAESLMLDTCTISRAGAETFDDATGTYSDTESTVYSGKCRLKPSVLSADRVAQAAERQIALWPFSVSLPVDVTDVELDDVVTVTASQDPSLVGVRLRIRSVARGTYLTARRVDCEEVSSG